MPLNPQTGLWEDYPPAQPRPLGGGPPTNVLGTAGFNPAPRATDRAPIQGGGVPGGNMPVNSYAQQMAAAQGVQSGLGLSDQANVAGAAPGWQGNLLQGAAEATGAQEQLRSEEDLTNYFLKQTGKGKGARGRMVGPHYVQASWSEHAADLMKAGIVGHRRRKAKKERAKLATERGTRQEDYRKAATANELRRDKLRAEFEADLEARPAYPYPYR